MKAELKTVKFHDTVPLVSSSPVKQWDLGKKEDERAVADYDARVVHFMLNVGGILRPRDVPFERIARMDIFVEETEAKLAEDTRKAEERAQLRNDLTEQHVKTLTAAVRAKKIPIHAIRGELKNRNVGINRKMSDRDLIQRLAEVRAAEEAREHFRESVVEDPEGNEPEGDVFDRLQDALEDENDAADIEAENEADAENDPQDPPGSAGTTSTSAEKSAKKKTKRKTTRKGGKRKAAKKASKKK